VKNCHIFEDTEENKLEYTTIYEEFVATSEKAIEAKLKEKSGLDDDAFANFLQTFATHKD